MEMEDAREIWKRSAVHGARGSRYPPLAALCGPSRGAVAWAIRAEDALSHGEAFVQPILGQLRSSVILVSNS